jgi:putative peptidoglycan lipid II flippase
LTASALLFLLIGAFAFASQTIVVRAYYAMKNTLFPAVFGTVAVAASIPIYYAGMKFMGVDGVGLAISLSAIMQVALLFILWNRRTDNSGSRAVYRAYLKIMLVSVPAGFFLHWVKNAFFARQWEPTLLGSILICAASGALFAVLISVAGYVFKIQEIRWFYENLAGKIRAGRRSR